ncbi:MAG: hypothetical protein LUQ65_01755 [Candidatus Helarchaeota archaeon]|nr:hypothetical protein [Candidatus Helarchaeota archaeon]
MNLREYGSEIVLTTLGLSEFYRPFIHGYDTKSELIAKFLTGEMIEETSREPLSPKVNLLIKDIEMDLHQNLPQNIPYVRKWYWPNWKEYAVCISHDVDKISESKRHIWKIRKRFSKLTVIKALLGISNPYNDLKLYTNLEKKYGASSSFFFLTNEYDFKKIAKDIQILKQNNKDIGLHGGFGTHNDAMKLKDEKEKLEKIIEQPVYGLRQHFLKFEFPTTWITQNEAKILYDTTVGFNDKVGFKIGIALPFSPPGRDLTPLPLIELPLVIMDAAVWTGLKLTEETALQIIQQIRDIIKENHGLLTLLWHNNVLRMHGGRIYKDILNLLVDQSVYIASGAEMAKWWQGRNRFQVLINQNNGTIEFRNPENIQNLGILIRQKGIEIISTTPNIQLVEKAAADFKFLYSSGLSGEIKINYI